MRLFSVLAGILITFAAPIYGAAPLRKVPGATPDGYIVTLTPDTPAASYADALTRSAGAKLVHVYDVVLNGFSVRATEQQALALPICGVTSVTQTRYLAPTVTRSPSVDGPDRIDQRNVPLDDSFTYTMFTTPTNIYIVDTGVDPRAEFGNRLTNVNFYTNDSGIRNPSDYTDGGEPLNDIYHGTPSAVIAAGSENGIAPFARVFNVRVCSHSTCRSDDIVAGINWVTQQKLARPSELHIANASYAGAFLSDPAMDPAYGSSINAGVGWVFAAGNGYDFTTGADACNFYPARLASMYSGAITVGASHPGTDVVEIYSNQGSCVDIFAPGQTEWGIPNRSAAGTSIAAPHVAGVFAIRWANSPASTAAEIEGVVKGTATPGVLTNLWPTSPNLLVYSAFPRMRPCCT